MRAGIGRAPITPTPPVYLAGFGARTQPAGEVHDDLEARALFLSDGSTSLCLVVCDLLGMSPSFAYPARDAIVDALGLAPECVLLACTHTHSGPSAMAGTDALGWPSPEGFGDVLRDGSRRAAVDAREAATDAELRYLRAPLSDGLSFNRRGLPYEQPTFNVLDIIGTNARIGVVANLSIHPVLLGPEWLKVATDWVGPFRTALEQVAGGTAIELTGSLGDINPTPPAGEPGDTYAPWASSDQTADYGERLARVVAGALPGAEPIEQTLRVVRNETIDAVAGGTPISALLEDPKLHVDLVEWALGDVRLVSMPGEAFYLLGCEIAAARNDRVLLAGLAPVWHGYLPHPWGEGYEEGVSYGEEFVATVRDALTRAP